MQHARAGGGEIRTTANNKHCISLISARKLFFNRTQQQTTLGLPLRASRPALAEKSSNNFSAEIFIVISISWLAATT